MGLLNLITRISKGAYGIIANRLTDAELDSNWTKIDNAFPTPASGNTDVGKALTLNANKTGYEYTALPGGGGNTLQFPADPSLDISLHKNRLVMNDGGVAKLANLSGGVKGAKGKFRITTDSLPQYPIGAIYEFDFMGVNFNDGDEIAIPIIENSNQVNSFIVAIAKNSPFSSAHFQIGVDLASSLISLLNVLQTHVIGAWEVSIDGSKIVFRNNHILTGIGGSTSYGLPTEYNGREAMFIRRDISQFNSQIIYTVDGGFTQASFQDVYNAPVVINLDPINIDNYYPLTTGNGYFVDTNGNLAYYNGSSYENVTSITRDELGNLILISTSNTSNSGVYPQWTPTFSNNLGTNYTITQTRQGVDGIVQSWVDANLNQNSQGFMIYLNDGNCNQRLAIHAFDMMGDFSNLSIPPNEYADWNIPTTPLELSKILKENFIQNPNTFFNVTADGHINNEAWIEIEEIVLQTQGNCNPSLITWNENAQGSNPFSTWFVRTQLETPILGSLPALNRPILGFLQDIVNGKALISDNNVNIGVVEDVIGNELTQQQLDDATNNNFYYLHYILGTDGQLRKLLFYGNGNFNESFILPLIFFGGGVFLCSQVAGRGEEVLFRRVMFFN